MILSRLLLILLITPFIHRENVPQDILQKIINLLISPEISATLPNYIQTIQGKVYTSFYALIMFHFITSLIHIILFINYRIWLFNSKLVEFFFHVISYHTHGIINLSRLNNLFFCLIFHYYY